MNWHHIGIQVRDLNISIKFYEKMFGFVVINCLILHGEKIVFLRNGPVMLELIKANEAHSYANSVHFSWQVKDLNAHIATLNGAGLNPVEGPVEIDYGWTCVFYEGPDKEIIELIEIKSIGTDI
ncbi:VOC family protein [Bacillus aquiflavi]|uniref:VOC family protein n=1 Tax=Bacillus aquiflavi TaxID=2672567 RepID=A0A6B3VXK9_9BACI|nr:VOC family protein [Bacillus aquiflavi]MBA4538680.1 VOC family protein [Bacillus aquiflavi]NEY83040.1 hypothetical protein [Bacillus aquiflavi]UAC48015.1 VOC family protein [Bacillus aquiflavi]